MGPEGGAATSRLLKALAEDLRQGLGVQDIVSPGVNGFRIGFLQGVVD